MDDDESGIGTRIEVTRIEVSGDPSSDVEPDLFIAGQATADIARTEALVRKVKRRPLLLART